jgi:hypothetical protein
MAAAAGLPASKLGAKDLRAEIQAKAENLRKEVEEKEGRARSVKAWRATRILYRGRGRGRETHGGVGTGLARAGKRK